jgi:ribosomal protein L24E
VTQLPEQEHDTCAFCGKPIRRGEGRFAIKGGAADVKCYDEWKTQPSKP